MSRALVLSHPLVCYPRKSRQCRGRHGIAWHHHGEHASGPIVAGVLVAAIGYTEMLASLDAYK